MLRRRHRWRRWAAQCTLLVEAPDVLAKSLVRVLPTTLEVLGVARVHVSALEIPHKNFLEVVPVIDATGWKVIQPSSHRVSQELGKIADDEAIIICTARLAGEVLVVELGSGFVSPEYLVMLLGGRNRVGVGALRMSWQRTQGPGGSELGPRSSSRS
jgi:hypothetical protein